MAQAEIAKPGLWERLGRSTRHGDIVFWLITIVFALMVIGLVVAIGVVTYGGSAAARREFGLSFLVGQEWNPVDTDVSKASFGAWPAVRGTLFSSAIAVLLAAPIGV